MSLKNTYQFAIQQKTTTAKHNDKNTRLSSYVFRPFDYNPVL